MSVVRRHIADGAVTPKKLDETTGFKWSYFIATGYEFPNVVGMNSGAAKVTAPTTLNAWASGLWKCGPTAIRYLLAATPVAPIKGSEAQNTDLDLSAPLTDAGREYVWAGHPEVVSGHPAREPFIYTVGSGAPMHIRFKASIDTVANQYLRVGFRKGIASPTTFDNHTDAACLFADVGDIKIATILNNAATVETDTGQDWADGEEHEFRVVLTGAGVARFIVDGVEYGNRFTFDDGDEIFPFVEVLNSAAGSAIVRLNEMEVAYLADIDDQFIH